MWPHQGLPWNYFLGKVRKSLENSSFVIFTLVAGLWAAARVRRTSDTTKLRGRWSNAAWGGILVWHRDERVDLEMGGVGVRTRNRKTDEERGGDSSSSPVINPKRLRLRSRRVRQGFGGGGLFVLHLWGSQGGGFDLEIGRAHV